MLDRIDMHVEVPALSLQELKGPPGEGSAAVAARVCPWGDKSKDYGDRREIHFMACRGSMHASTSLPMWRLTSSIGKRRLEWTSSIDSPRINST